MNINQQMTDYLAKVGVEVQIERDENITEREGFLEGSRHYDVFVSNQSGDSFRCMYSQGPAIKREPCIFDVFHSLISDYYYGGLSFEDFCSDLGCDEDSRKAHKLWQDLRALNLDMYRVLGDDIVRSIQVIVQDH